MNRMFRILSISLLAMAGLALAQDNPRGEFYIKDQVKGFFSIKTEMRNYTDQAMSDINDVAFRQGLGFATIKYDSTNKPIDTTFAVDRRVFNYKQFVSPILGFGGEVGAQYHQLLTWVDGYFMAPQSSKVPSSLAGTGMQDVRWHHYGFNLMCGYMLAPEQSVINLIPSVGFGFSLMNARFASNYNLLYSTAPDAEMKWYTMTDRYYSSFAKDLNTQVELRLNLGAGISLGGYTGIRMTWVDQYTIESGQEDYFLTQNTVAHNWFIGGKVTYTLPSVYETKEKEKL